MVLISMLIVLTMISWPLALIFIVCIVLLFMVTVPALKERMQYDAKEGEASSKLTGYFSDTISNVLNVKVFSSAFFEIKNFNKVVNERRDIENISYKIGNKLIAIQAGLGELVEMAIFGCSKRFCAC